MEAPPRERLSRALERLERDGLIERPQGVPRTTRAWQGAMARAALRLFALGDPGADLRVPIAHALVAVYGSRLDDEELVDCVEAMLPVEAAGLGLVPGDNAGPPQRTRA